MSNCFWNPATLEVAYEVRPDSRYSQEGTIEEYQALVNSLPAPPEPDWTSFNLTLIPPDPGAQTSFEVWLAQFKIQHQAPLTAAAGTGNLAETQQLYNSLKEISSDPSNLLVPPTPEQIAEWQGVANQNNIGLTF